MTVIVANFGLYLPTEQLDFGRSLPSGKLKKGLLGPAREFVFATSEASVALLLRHPDLRAHLDGFRGYIHQLDDAESDKRAAIARITAVKMAIGVNLSQPISLEGKTFEAIKGFAFAHGGFVFVQDSILTEEGYFVGPARTDVFMKPAASVRVDIPDYAAGASESATSIRERTMAELKAAGFKPAANLPYPDAQAELRPKEEIAGRFCALLDLFLYAAAPEKAFPEAALRRAISSYDLTRFLTVSEKAILSLSRANANRQLAGAIGWRLENMLPLAWLLGMEPKPSISAQMVGGEEIDVMTRMHPAPGVAWMDYVGGLPLRSAEEAQALEDLFYCAHNAVRSAQLGHETVPEGFHPVANGGVIHERRHALTWAISPDDDWDETDLST